MKQDKNHLKGTKFNFHNGDSPQLFFHQTPNRLVHSAQKLIADAA